VIELPLAYNEKDEIEAAYDRSDLFDSGLQPAV
jgi:hypothetical protein